MKVCNNAPQLVTRLPPGNEFRPKKQPIQIKQFHLNWGEAILIHNVKVRKTHPYGFVSLALGLTSIGGILWAILSNETTSLQTFREYGLRFDIEENF